MVKICILASSSAGNAAFVATDRTRLLIDAGLSRREVTRRLAAIGEDIRSLDAILITHEHCDHTCGLVAVMKASERRIPVYLTHGTAPFVDWGESRPVLQLFQAGCCFSIGDFEIASFTVSHDAQDPVGFTLTAQGVKVALATDLGYVTPNVTENLRNSDVVVLEANHDLEMLRVGPYPWSVKQRVMSRRGHLSNEVAADFIQNQLDSRLSTLVLGHISEHNNHVPIVQRMGEKALAGRSLLTRLVVAQPGVQSEVFCY